MVVRENNVSVTVQVSPFVHDKHGDEICKLHDGLLIMVDLSPFDLDKLVRDIFSNMQHALFSQHVLNHLIIFGFQKLEDIISCQIEVRIVGDSQFQLKIFSKFSDEPGIMHEFSSFLKLWVHNKRHEVVLVQHSVESGLHENVFSVLTRLRFLLIFLSFFLLFTLIFFLQSLFLGLLKFQLLGRLLIEILFKGIEQTLVPIVNSKISNSCFIFDQFEQILVIFDSLIS